jgi:hypothetical protein|tara:strand:- start:2099 stop:2242 length:144 start_codon:yes stop_codon:yes gene_type:complete
MCDPALNTDTISFGLFVTVQRRKKVDFNVITMSGYVNPGIGIGIGVL